MSHEKIFEIQADLCRAMGNPLRMEIVHLLRSGPLKVNDIASAVEQQQATVSRNLAILRNAGIVVTHRDGKNILYQVANPNRHQHSVKLIIVPMPGRDFDPGGISNQASRWRRIARWYK